MLGSALLDAEISLRDLPEVVMSVATTAFRWPNRSSEGGRWMAPQVGSPSRKQHYVEEVGVGALVYETAEWWPVGYHAVCGVTVIEADDAYLDQFEPCPLCKRFCQVRGLF
jgi:hypothetical protein